MKIHSSLLSFVCSRFSINQKFGGWSISKGCHDFILEHTQEGEVLVELGSGRSTRLFSDKLCVYTVEHSLSFLKKNIDKMMGGKYPIKFIHSPIVEGWYDAEVLRKHLPSSSAAVLVDGPPGYIGRSGILKHLELFSSTRYLVFDDVHRASEHKALTDAAQILHRDFTIQKDGSKKWGVITL